MEVHIWEINGFVKLNQKYANGLNQKIMKKFGSISKFAIKCKTDRRIIARACQREGNGFIKISNLFKFTPYLNIDKSEVERHIEFYKDSRAGAYERVYKLKFPFIITPKTIRLVSHILGDGSVYRDCIKYSQKDTTYIKKLAEDIVKPLGTLRARTRYENKLLKEQIFAIPMIAAKCIAKYFDISVKDFKRYIFIEKCLNLPKEFKIQVLAALMIDEGHVPKKKISLMDKKIIEKICELIDSLGYKRSNIRVERYHHRYKDKIYVPEMYSIVLLGEGIRDFANDLKITVNKYGYLLNLWFKQNELDDVVESHDYIYLRKINKTKELREKIVSLANKEKIIRRQAIIEQFSANPDNVDFILKTLQQRKVAIRIDRGVYSYVKK